jgi:hypothetical protein
MIRDSMTPDKRNVINISQSLSLTMMNSLSDAVLNNKNNEMIDYRQFLNSKEFDDTDAFAHFIQDRSHAVVFANNHYVSILKISGYFVVIDGIPRFGIYAYSSLDELMPDLLAFVRGSMIVLCHARLFGQTELDCIVIDDDDDVTEQPDLPVLISDSSDEDECKDVPTSSSESGDTSSGDTSSSDSDDMKKPAKPDSKPDNNRVEVDGAVDPASLSIFENADEIREHVEAVINDRSKKKGQIFENATNDRRCRIMGCEFKRQEELHGFCHFHNRVGFFTMCATNGRICETPSCSRKAMNYRALCDGCRFPLSKWIAKNKTDKKMQKHRWSLERVKRVSLAIAKKYATLIKKHPAIRIYVGITCRKPKKRIGEHKSSGKDFDDYAIELEVPNLYSLAETSSTGFCYISAA